MMKKYRVLSHFQGSLFVDVEAENEDEALEIGESIIECMSNDELAAQANFDACEAYELK